MHIFVLFGSVDTKVLLKKSMSIGAGGCGNIQPFGSSIFLRATEFITIYGNFEVPLGAELYIDANNCY